MSDGTRRTRSLERLAGALQECFDAAVESGAAEAVSQVKSQVSTLHRRMDTLHGRMDTLEGRMDRQDATLRMVWNQVKGQGSLPIDP